MGNKWIEITAVVAFIAAALIPTAVNAEQTLKLTEISYSGFIRVDGDFNNTDPAVGDSTKTSDIKASKVKLILVAAMSEQVMGSAAFVWAGGDTDRVDVDKAVIVVTPKDWPLKFSLGKQGVPFGSFNYSFMADTLAVVLGDTADHSINVIYTTGIAEISAGIYNGDVHEAGEGDHIDGFTAQLNLNFADNFSTGFSLISNIAESYTLVDNLTTANTVQDTVAGFATNIFYKFDKLELNAEYVTALDEFAAGELTFDGGNSYQPQAITFEAAYSFDDSLVAVRIEAGEDGGSVIAENTFGIHYTTPILEYLIFKAEYQRSEYENNDKADALKLRLRMNF